MRLTSAAEYGIRALLYLSLQPPDKVCLISEISKVQNIPEKFLAKIMQSLSKGGLVKSFRGVKGGFSLARLPEEITLKDAVECLEGPMALNKCLIGEDSCERSGTCPVHLVWKDAQDKFIDVLDKANLKNLAEKAALLGN